MINKEEIYGILDNTGNTIGSASWKEVHEKGLLHQVVAAFIFEDATFQKLLIQKRSRQMTQDPGKWNHSVGGHVLYLETAINAIYRETQEELFDQVNPPNIHYEQVITFFQEDIPGNKERLTLFRAIYPGPFYPEQGELEGPPKWVTLNSLHRDIEKHPNLYTVSFTNSLREYLKSC
jgi:isopentenyldiphosphate isomerase